MRKVRAGNYAYATDVSRGTFLDCGVEDSRTKQSFAKDADINELVKRFGVTGLAQRYPVEPATVQMFDDVFDYQSAMNAIVDAERRFGMLDAELRLRFLNDPQRFVAFCSDPKNLDEMVKLGLAVSRKKDDNTPAPNGSGKEKVDEQRDSDSGEGKGGAASKGSAGGAGGK